MRDDLAAAGSSAATAHSKPNSLFEVYLRLRPPTAGAPHASRFITVEAPGPDAPPSQITLNPPSDRRRALEKFSFTQIFEEDTTQLDLFHGINAAALVEGVLAPHGAEGTDALVATLGVTGSGKVTLAFRRHTSC